MKIYIYCLLDPRNDDVRYVGVTSNPIQRLVRHNWNGKNFRYHCANWVNSLHNLKLRPVMDIIDECNETNRQEREKYWIKTYRAMGCDLTNLSDGGEGQIGLKHSESTRKKMSVSKIGNKNCVGRIPWNKGKHGGIHKEIAMRAWKTKKGNQHEQ